MPRFRGQATAFGFPGIPATWTCANKQGVGTAYSCGSRIWFTIAHGILTETFYPRIDTPQLRGLEFLFSDGNELFLEEKRDFEHEVERIVPAQGYLIRSSDRSRRFSLTKEIIAEPTRPCIVMRVELQGDDEFLDQLGMYVYCEPHLCDAGSNNNAYIIEDCGRQILAAEKNGTWLVVGASCRFSRLSCGYVGSSDGYSDLAKNGRMALEFDRATDGNVALTAQLNLSTSRAFVLGVAFGETLEHSVANLFQSLGTEYEDQRRIFARQWEHTTAIRKPLEKASQDNGRLYEASCALLLAAEDKTYQGAFVASPSIPWGEARDDQEGKGGYHLVWTRDMVEVAMGLLAAGYTRTPLRTVINFAARQKADGGFTQNSWVDGKSFRNNVQLDEVAFPVLLAERLSRDGLLGHFEVAPMVCRAANFLLHSGPVTGEERWEELGGYSPSTLATVIAAEICAAHLLRASGEEASAALLEQYADYLVAHLEEWTVTGNGSLSPKIHRYFVRLNPAKPGEVAKPGAVDQAELKMPDQPPGEPDNYPARDVVDAGFLQLVRYGILAPDDPLIMDSLTVVDQALMRCTPAGKCWRRYNRDGYGQRPDGGPFEEWGQGGSWPLLAGERAHYELAAGGNYCELIRALEQFAAPNDLLPEQIWDEADRPEAGLYSGRPTGSAVPLHWAHAEYIRLLRSAVDGQVFDLIPEVAARYLKQKPESRVEYWLPKHPIQRARRQCTLRICAPEPFRLRWSDDHWATCRDSNSIGTAIGADYCDLASSSVEAGVEFTFFWKHREQWEGRNYRVERE
ncbi:MAG: glycoside hydrolase family 15 protein [Bryobacteraceae bacterium]